MVRFRSSVEYIVEETRCANSLGVAYSAVAPFSRTPGYLLTFIPSNSNSQSASYQFCADRQSGFIAVGRSLRRSAPVNRRARILSVTMCSSNDASNSSRLVNIPPWRSTTLAMGPDRHYALQLTSLSSSSSGSQNSNPRTSFPESSIVSYRFPNSSMSILDVYRLALGGPVLA